MMATTPVPVEIISDEEDLDGQTFSPSMMRGLVPDSEIGDCGDTDLGLEDSEAVAEAVLEGVGDAQDETKPTPIPADTAPQPKVPEDTAPDTRIAAAADAAPQTKVPEDAARDTSIAAAADTAPHSKVPEDTAPNIAAAADTAAPQSKVPEDTAPSVAAAADAAPQSKVPEDTCEADPTKATEASAGIDTEAEPVDVLSFKAHWRVSVSTCLLLLWSCVSCCLMYRFRESGQGNPSRLEQAASVMDVRGQSNLIDGEIDPASKAKRGNKGRGRGGRGGGRGPAKKGNQAPKGRGRGRGRGRGNGGGNTKAAAEAEDLKTPSPRAKKDAEDLETPTKTKAPTSKRKADNSEKKAPKSKTPKKAKAKDEAKKRKRHSEDQKSFARRARPKTETALGHWLAIRDAYNAMLSARFNASHQDSQLTAFRCM